MQCNSKGGEMSSLAKAKETSQKSVLITGSTGFVGRNLIPVLIEKGHRVLCVVRNVDKATELYGSLVSYCTIEQSEKICSFQPDICIHLASYLTSSNNAEASEKIVNANIVYGCKLLNILKDVPSLELFINFGTFAEYRLGPSKESQAYLYSASKTAFKELLKYYSELSGYKYLHLIPYTIYGGIDTQKKVIDFLKYSFNAKEPVKMSNGEQILDFIHVLDVVDFVNYAIDNYTKFVEDPNCDYHLGTGKGTSIRELAKLLEQKYNKKCNIDFGALPYRERDIMYAVAPIGQLIKMGWRPKISLISSI